MLLVIELVCVGVDPDVLGLKSSSARTIEWAVGIKSEIVVEGNIVLDVDPDSVALGGDMVLSTVVVLAVTETALSSGKLLMVTARPSNSCTLLAKDRDGGWDEGSQAVAISCSVASSADGDPLLSLASAMQLARLERRGSELTLQRPTNTH